MEINSTQNLRSVTGNNLARAMSFERAAAAALIDICDRNGRQPLTKTKPIKQNKDE